MITAIIITTAPTEPPTIPPIESDVCLPKPVEPKR